MTKKILMACGNYWTSPIQVGDHHLARAFAQNGWEVAFLSAPLTPLHFLRKTDQGLRDRLSIYRHNGVGDLDSKIWGYVPGSLIAPASKFFLNSKWVYQNWCKYTCPNLVNLLKERGFTDVDLIYFRDPRYVYLLNAIKYKRSVYRIADKDSGFDSHTDTMAYYERKIARRVDVVVYTARNLKSHVEKLGPQKMSFLPNGVNFNHFANGPNIIPEEYKKIKQPIAIYVGTMDVWFDYDLINETARALPEISFVLIGPDKLARQRLESLPNIHLLGSRNYKELPAYLHNSNVGLIPFDVKGHADLVNSINPLKLYEYMACGLPVVSVAWEELENLHTPATLCRTREEFINGIKYQYQHKADTDTLKNYALQHDWMGRVKLIQKTLNLNSGPIMN